MRGKLSFFLKSVSPTVMFLAAGKLQNIFLFLVSNWKTIISMLVLVISCTAPNIFIKDYCYESQVTLSVHFWAKKIPNPPNINGIEKVELSKTRHRRVQLIHGAKRKHLKNLFIAWRRFMKSFTSKDEMLLPIFSQRSL